VRVAGDVLDFMRALWRVNHALERVSSRMEGALGVTAQQRMVVRWVGKDREITAGALAARLHVDAGTVSAACKRLERKGLLRRRRDERDRRRVVLALTATGRALDRPTAGTVESAISRLLADTPAREVQAAERVLAALCESLEVEAARADGAAGTKRRKP
jgi:DNA-binding MarR family transcriptional regulator